MSSAFEHGFELGQLHAEQWRPIASAPKWTAVLVKGRPYRSRGELVAVAILEGNEWRFLQDLFGWFDPARPESDDCDEGDFDTIDGWRPLSPGVATECDDD